MRYAGAEGGVVDGIDGEAPALDGATLDALGAAEVDDAVVLAALVGVVVDAATDGVSADFFDADVESDVEDPVDGAEEAAIEPASPDVGLEPAPESGTEGSTAGESEAAVAAVGETAAPPTNLPADAFTSVPAEEPSSSPAEDFATDLAVAEEVALNPVLGPVLAVSDEVSSVEAADLRVARFATEGAASSDADAASVEIAVEVVAAPADNFEALFEAGFEVGFEVDFVAFAAGEAPVDSLDSPDSPDSASDASATMVAVAAAPPAFANHSRIVSARPTETGDKWVAISGISSAWQRATMSLELTPSSLAS